MSIIDLLTDTVTFHRTTSTDRDAIGALVDPVETSLTVACYAEPLVSASQRREDERSRNTQIGEWLVVIAAGVDVSGFDRATLHGQSMDIVAPPAPFRDLTTGLEHHQELRLLAIT